MAQATSLVAIFLAAISGAVSYGLGGEVLIIPALIIAGAGIIGTFIGAGLLHRMAEHQVHMLFVVILVVAAVGMAWGSDCGGGVGLGADGGRHVVGVAVG